MVSFVNVKNWCNSIWKLLKRGDIMILYFSASGNSRFIAETAKEMLSDNLCCLNDQIKKHDISEIYSDTPFILVCPVFAWRIPRVVQEYLQHIVLSGNGKIYLLVTTCGSSGNTGGYAKRFFRGIGKEWMGWHTFYMPGSYVAFMENPDLEHAEEMNRIARGQLKALIPMIKNEEQLNSFKVTGAGRFMSFAANLFFYRYIIARDGFYATERCIGCGKCSVVCPLNNIDIVNRKPQWGSVCTHCMACVHQCPERAVEFRKISVGKNRYYNQGK